MRGESRGEMREEEMRGEIQVLRDECLQSCITEIRQVPIEK